MGQRWTALIGALLLGACSIQQSMVIGTFTMFNRDAPFLVAAPHGAFDSNTDELVYAFCGRVRWDCLVAEGFRSSDAELNVNRPTEGYSLASTEFTERAAVVYAKYLSRIRRLSVRPRFYVEIHGHGDPNLRRIVDIATVGVTKAQALRIQEVLTTSLQRQQIDEISVRIDVLESVKYGASHARKFGVLSFLKPAIHIELPLSLRHARLSSTVDALVEALPQIAGGFALAAPTSHLSR